MNIKKIIKILRTEEFCVKIANANVGICDRKCEECPLVMNSEDIIEAYEKTIKILKKMI